MYSAVFVGKTLCQLDLIYFATQVPDTSDTSATQMTQVRHECYTSDTSATRVLHERHECDASRKF